jgi:hypothetical protein
MDDFPILKRKTWWLVHGFPASFPIKTLIYGGSIMIYPFGDEF